MTQTWNRLLFAHWPVTPDVIRPMIPPGLTLDTFDGDAWISVVPFDMTDIRLRGLPRIPGAHQFPELNVRTYVKHADNPGVWFFSLDAAHRLAVRAARTALHLPYFDAAMNIRVDRSTVEYRSARTHVGAKPGRFHARYRPTGPVRLATPGSLDDWLTARFCLYANAGSKRLRCDIHHLPWPLQPVETEILENTLVPWLPQLGEGPRPLVHYAHQLQTFIWPPVSIRDGV